LVSCINRSKKMKKIYIYVFAVIVFFIFTAPLLWLIICSLQNDANLLSVPPNILPKDPTLINYYQLLLGRNPEGITDEIGIKSYSVPREAKIFPQAILNSFIVGIGTTLLCLASGTFSAYALARLKFIGSRKYLFLVLATRMIPGLTLAIPFFLIAKSYGLIDKKITLIIINASFTLPYTIWLLKGFFEAIPRDIEDAARVDGCTKFQTIYKIILPLSKPGLVGTGIFAFMLSWNEFFYALLLTNTEKSFTIPIVLSMFGTELDINYSLMITAGVVAIIPPILFTLIFQKYIVEGITAGSIKG